MNIQSANNLQGTNFYGKTGAVKTQEKEVAVSDKFAHGGATEQLDADKMKSLATGEGKKAHGKSEALGILGIGVMMGGIMLSAAIGGPFAPALMIGSMFGGLAIVAGSR